MILQSDEEVVGIDQLKNNNQDQSNDSEHVVVGFVGFCELFLVVSIFVEQHPQVSEGGVSSEEEDCELKNKEGSLACIQISQGTETLFDCIEDSNDSKQVGSATEW